MYEVTIIKSFSAAHLLAEIGGKCEELHGHNFKVEVTVATEYHSVISCLGIETAWMVYVQYSGKNTINYLAGTYLRIIETKNGRFITPPFLICYELNYYGNLDAVNDITPLVTTIDAVVTPQALPPAHVIEPELLSKLDVAVVTPVV